MSNNRIGTLTKKCKNGGKCVNCGECNSLLKSRKEEIPGGLADGKDPKEFDSEQLAIGTGVETEHTDDPKVAMEIAMDHLVEDPNYYKKLAECVEPKLKSIRFSILNKNRPVVRKIDFQGLPISIEVDKNQILNWYDDYENRSGKTKMHYPYGYIRRTNGEDGEQIDVFVGPNKDSKRVFICHQVKGKEFNIPDEDKVMLGFNSPKEAKSAFLVHYDNPKYLGSMTETSIDSFKERFLSKSFQGLGMMPPLLDVETFEGVQNLLNKIGTVKDDELMQISEEIWGKGYDFSGKPPEQARQEIIGFLLDQRDLLGVMPPPNEYEISADSQDQSGLGLEKPLQGSQTSVNENTDQSLKENSSVEDLNQNSSISSLFQDYLQKQKQPEFTPMN